MFKENRKIRILYLILILIIVAVTLLPIYWAASLSFRSPGEALSVKGLAVPFLQYKPTINNWKTVLGVVETQRALINSIIISVSTAFLVIIIGAPAAYAIARFKFKKISNENITVWFLSQRILPPVVTVIPFFLIIRFLGLIDTHVSLILVNITFNLPLVIVVLRQSFIDLPVEFEEAALVDGANHLGIFWKISLRLILPSLVAVFLLAIAFTWNEFLFALTFSTLKVTTIPVLMAGSMSTRGIEFWFLAVRTLIAILPPIIIALLTQRFIVQGLTLGGIKG